MFKIINGTKININPTVVEQSTYQKHGLRPADRKPNDYLRMVARTFSSFRNTPSTETVVSYINGFEITHNDASVIETIDWLPKKVEYDIFKVNKGVCIIDNQLVDIYEDAIFYFDKTTLLKNERYAITVEYDYIEQYSDNSAIIRFIPYKDLTFPRIGDSNVVTCKFTDNSLNGLLSSTEFSGKPGLLIATFAVDSNGNITRSFPEQGGGTLPGLDPQFLSKLYIQNYKLLFEYFGDQARSIFSSMGMTQATFISIDRTKLANDLKSGDMCYFDGDTGKYQKSVASRQKFNQVVGLYLNEYQEDNHLIYLNGVINIDQVKHNLPDNHILLTMIPGRHYFLEDQCSLFDTNHPTMTVDNYILTDSSGRISLRFYPGAVRVGYSTACNQLFLNIDHSLEIGTGNLLGLFGNAEEYKTEYLANTGSISAAAAITFSNNRIDELYAKISSLNAVLGSDNYSEMLTWGIRLNSEKFNYLLYQVLELYFAFGTNKDIVNLNPKIPTSVLDQFTTSQKIDIESGISKYNHLKNITNLIKIAISEINNLIIEKTGVNIYYGTDATNNTTDILNNKLKIARLKLFDHPDIMENFENLQIDISTDTTLYDYSTLIDTLNNNNLTLQTSTNTTINNYQLLLNQITELTTMSNTLTVYLSNIENLINNIQVEIMDCQQEISKLEKDILQYVINKSRADSKIISTPNLRLDIFLMDEYQRQVFNYTYITDRLRRRLYLIETIANDLLKAEVILETRLGSVDSTIIEKLAAQQEVDRMNNLVKVNNDLITNYTLEYNKIRKDVFALPPITKGDLNFDEGGISDQRIGTYRYGCDPDDVYNGLASNTFSPFVPASFIRVDPYPFIVNDLTDITFSGTTSGIVGNLTIEIAGTINTVNIVNNNWTFTRPSLSIGNYITKIIGNDKDGLEFIKIEAFKVEPHL